MFTYFSSSRSHRHWQWSKTRKNSLMTAIRRLLLSYKNWAFATMYIMLTCRKLRNVSLSFFLFSLELFHLIDNHRQKSPFQQRVQTIDVKRTDEDKQMLIIFPFDIWCNLIRKATVTCQSTPCVNRVRCVLNRLSVRSRDRDMLDENREIACWMNGLSSTMSRLVHSLYHYEKTMIFFFLSPLSVSFSFFLSLSLSFVLLDDHL